MKNLKHQNKANKFMLAMSLVLFLSAGLILGVKAFTIDTSLLNTMQVIKRIVISNTNSTSSADVLVDINNDSAGTVYIKNKLGIGNSTPSAALQVSGNIIANQYCDSDGTTCNTIANMQLGGSSGIYDGYVDVVTFNSGTNILTVGLTGHTDITTNLSSLSDTETDPIYSGGTNGKICIQTAGKIECTEDPSSGGVDGDTSATNELQSLSIAGNILSLSGDTNTVDLSGYLDSYWKESISGVGGAGAGDVDIAYISGDVAIGIASPTEALHVSGNVLANAFLYPSDRRLKTNIVELNPALDKIRKINAYSFDRIANGKSSIGFIAQELEEIYPELVHTNDDGYKSVNYVNMVIPLTQAVKELDAENQELKAEIAEIKAMLAKQ